LKHRLFISLDLPESVRREITILEARLDSLHLPLVMQEPEKLHLTLNFIGNYDKDATDNLASAVAQKVSGCAPFTLRPFFLETLYQKHDASLVYLGLTGDLTALQNLHDSLSQVLIPKKIPQPRRFLPHISIAKIKKADPVLTKKILDQIRDINFSPLTEFTADRLSLYQSILSQKGSTYRRLRQFMLK
jgi:RNA 2',3'-cyclic 3'-phosphodiesterase